MSKVSIIIPVYNTEEYISECLQSLVNQSYKDIEFIVINDNSTDDSKKIIENFSKDDDRIKPFHFDNKKGVGAIRNFGVNKAKGDYIYFLDSDDYLPKDTIEFLINSIGNSDIIGGKIKATNLSSSFAVIFNGLFNPKIFGDNRYNLIRNNSALNFLISKKLIDENQLVFAENVELYSDLHFMVPALMVADQVRFLNEAIYFKRKRNDPIINPALSQYHDDTRLSDFLTTYDELKTKYQDRLIHDFLDEQLLNLYRKDFVVYFKDGKNIDELFRKLSTSVKRIKPELILKYDYVLKRELRAIESGNIKKYKRINRRHQLLRDFREGIKTKRKFFIFMYRRIFIKLPIRKNLIFFESFLGKNYSDSPKYIYEYLSEINANYQFVWSFEKKNKLPGKAKQVKRFSLRYFYYLARAKYWVSNSRLPKYLDKRRGNVFLQTWHGTPLKKLVFDMDEIYSADPKYKENFYNQSRRWDYLSSPNTYSSEIFGRAFRYDKKLLEYGYPRNDILYNKDNQQDISQLKSNMGISKDKKVILYAPTWRDDDYFAKGKYSFQLQLDLLEMQKALGNEYIILLRMHYFIANQIDLTSFDGFAYDFSSYDDIAELYLVSDILITDYSSVFFDYANLKRPILFYMYDLEKYRDQLRGFYLDIEKDLPGPLLKMTNEVIDKIQNIETVQENYEERYSDFYNKFCKWDDGNASENTVKTVFNIR